MHAAASRTGREVRISAEAAVTIPQEDADGTGAGAGCSQVLLAIAVEVADGNCTRCSPNRVVSLDTEPPLPLPRNTLTLPAEFAVAMSSLLSALKSPTTTYCGPSPVTYST